MAISPDGGYLAVLYPSTMERPTQLMVLPTTGGELREVFRAREGEHFRVGVLAWTPLGELIFGTHQHEEAVQEPLTELWSIRLDGERRPLGLALDRPTHLSVHPDGTHIAFELKYETDELWAMDNLLLELGR